MATVAASRARPRRLHRVAEHRGLLATLFVSPAVLFIALLVGAPLVLAVELSFTDATAGSLSGKWVGLRNFRQLVESHAFHETVWHTFLFTAISQAIVVVL